MDTAWLLEKIILLPPLLFSLVIHEMAHARTALAFGDPTAKQMGRLTLNPLAHLDPMGTLAILFIGFGWAKPVPINLANLHPRRLGEIAVSLAGPASNLALAFIIGLFLHLMLRFDLDRYFHLNDQVLGLIFYTLAVNVCLFTFNLIPLYPLDGHHILREILPERERYDFMRWQMQYGQFALFGMIGLSFFTNVSPIGWILGHAMRLAAYLIIPG